MSTTSQTRRANTAQPQRGPAHEALAMFLGQWQAEGTSFGGTDQSASDPRANGVPWTSEHRGYWHTGAFFLIQDEKAKPGGETFDTVSLMGVDPQSGAYFARSFENHGFYRHYHVTRHERTWRLDGETERATITFSADGRTQTIAWEWKPADAWLPLCDRVATRID